MTNRTLTQSHLNEPIARLDVLYLLFQKWAYSDVFGEAQKTVELALKGRLSFVGIEPPKIHDLGALLIEHQEKFPPVIALRLEKLTKFPKGCAKKES